MGNAYKIFVGKPEQKRTNIGLDIDGRMILL
jgi:hypothetical protein